VKRFWAFSKRPTKTRKPAINIFLKSKKFQKLINHGVVKDRTELAQIEDFTRARLTQILNLLNLAPEIQDYLSGLTDEFLLRYFTERRLRKITSE
jgi:hypothetical protein